MTTTTTNPGLSPRVDPLDVTCPRCKSIPGAACTIVRSTGAITSIRRGLHDERVRRAIDERTNRAADAEREFTKAAKKGADVRTALEAEKAKHRAKREHVRMGGGLMFHLACGHTLNLAHPNPVEVAATVGRSAMCAECEKMARIEKIDPLDTPKYRAAILPKVVDRIVDEAAAVLVDDRIFIDDEWHRVVATSRLEAGVEIVFRDRDGDDLRRHFLPTEEVEIAAVMDSPKHGCRLYRVANLRTHGLAVWVSIPE